MGPAQIRNIKDPMLRGKRAVDALGALEAQRVELMAIRDDAVKAAWAAGISGPDIAAALGVTKGRISQIVAGRP